MTLIPGSKRASALAVERVRAVTSKPDAESVLMTVGPVLPVAPATATFLIIDDISSALAGGLAFVLVFV